MPKQAHPSPLLGAAVSDVAQFDRAAKFPIDNVDKSNWHTFATDGFRAALSDSGQWADRTVFLVMYAKRVHHLYPQMAFGPKEILT